LKIAVARSPSHCKFFWFRLPEKRSDERRLVEAFRALPYRLLPWKESHGHPWFFLWMVVVALVLRILLLSEGNFFRDHLPDPLSAEKYLYLHGQWMMSELPMSKTNLALVKHPDPVPFLYLPPIVPSIDPALGNARLVVHPFL
jgi:hypothetical protein